MTTKPLNPQPGDIVHVRATIDSRRNEDGEFVISVKNSWCGLGKQVAISESEILAIEPRPLKVGDRVRWIDVKNNDSLVGMLKAIDQECVAWVRRDSGGYFTIQLSALTKEP